MINDLNAEQKAVVETGDGPCLVLAGAGSGKTRTITHRVAHLLGQGVDPTAILLVTFTNKAADEMKLRVAALTKNGKAIPWSGTFHHIGYRLLRLHAPMIGFKNNFTVLDTDDSESLLKLCIKEVKPDSGVTKFPSARVLQNIISFSRNARQPITAVVEEKFLTWIKVVEEIARAGQMYDTKKREANAMDFDDLLLKTEELLAIPEVLKKYATQFKYVLVDEYQDTNLIQAGIVMKMASVHKNILVVGDDSQSIYSFRAATIENILGFERMFPGARIFKLETNYRSTGPILKLANNIIANNTHQYQKKLRTVKPGEQLPVLQPQIDQQSEGDWVARQIETLLKDGESPNEIAVLFRAAAHSQMLEVELVARGIPYDYRGGVRFFERAHIKDTLAYLRIMANLADTAAWLRVLLHEEGVGPAAAEKVISAVKKLENISDIAGAGSKVLGGKAQAGWNHFLEIWNDLINAPVKSPTALIEALLGSAYSDYLETEYIDSRDRMMDLKQLALFAERYDSLDNFLAESTLQESFRGLNGAAEPSGQTSKVILSTIHQAKGLEWNTVFILNLSSGAFPSERALREEQGIEEERRLFYVAITRAKEKLFMTYPMAGGAYGDFLSGPSMFLGEINPELIDDRSLLSYNGTVLNDAAAGVTYEPEDIPFRTPPKIKPGSFLRSIDDL